MTIRDKKFLEITHLGALEGVVQIGYDGFASIHEEWLKRLILQAGRSYQEVGE